MAIKLQQGDRVYDVADERHVGVIARIVVDVGGRRFAGIRWEETGWLSCMVPVGGLRHAPRDRGAPPRSQDDCCGED
jgi:hypothetical protein